MEFQDRFLIVVCALLGIFLAGFLVGWGTSAPKAKPNGEPIPYRLTCDLGGGRNLNAVTQGPPKMPMAVAFEPAHPEGEPSWGEVMIQWPCIAGPVVLMDRTPEPSPISTPSTSTE